jgi:hypothetical protein
MNNANNTVTSDLQLKVYQHKTKKFAGSIARAKNLVVPRTIIESPNSHHQVSY